MIILILTEIMSSSILTPSASFFEMTIIVEENSSTVKGIMRYFGKAEEKLRNLIDRRVVHPIMSLSCQ